PAQRTHGPGPDRPRGALRSAPGRPPDAPSPAAGTGPPVTKTFRLRARPADRRGGLTAPAGAARTPRGPGGSPLPARRGGRLQGGGQLQIVTYTGGRKRDGGTPEPGDRMMRLSRRPR